MVEQLAMDQHSTAPGFVAFARRERVHVFCETPPTGFSAHSFTPNMARKVADTIERLDNTPYEKAQVFILRSAADRAEGWPE